MDTVKKEDIVQVIEFVEKQYDDPAARWEMLKSIVEESINRDELDNRKDVEP